MNINLLIIDDEPEFHRNMESAFRRQCVMTHAYTLKEVDEAMAQADKEPGGLDLVLLDLSFDKRGETQEGLDFIVKLKKKIPKVPIVVVTNDSRIETVVEAINKGANDFLHKPAYDKNIWLEKFKDVVEASKIKVEAKKIKRENIELKETIRRKNVEKQVLLNDRYPFVGTSDAAENTKRSLEIAGRNPQTTILITGETGVGKEVAARYLWQHSQRDHKDMVAVQLSAIQKSLMEGQLFGHVKGSFTDAIDNYTGYFHQADGGILFLDEIGDIDPEIQTKLLRFLELKIIRPIGAEKDIQLDIQIVTATNRNLKEEVEKGNFRQDLYYRLKAFEVKVPSLRKRKEDIPLILRHYLGIDSIIPLDKIIAPVTLNILNNYSWPGNIRELKHAVEGMLMKKQIHNLPTITEECLPDDIRNFSKPSKITLDSTPQTPKIEPKEISIAEQKAYIELKRIDDALAKTYGQKSKAADILGLSLDQILYRIKKYKKEFPELIASFSNISLYYKKLLQS